MGEAVLSVLIVWCGIISVVAAMPLVSPPRQPVSLLPSSGYDCLRFGRSCYIFTKTGNTWTKNRNSCKNTAGGDLVSMETEAEWQFINSKIQNLILLGDNEWHIGLEKQRNTWKWVSGSPLTIVKWQPSQPSGDGKFAVMAKNYPTGTRGLFNDLADHNHRAFICEIPKVVVPVPRLRSFPLPPSDRKGGYKCLPFDNSCYIFTKSGSDWTGNQLSCRGHRRGGDLVTMDTEAEWRFINSEIQKLTIPGADAEWHIGLVNFRNTWKWRWVSGWPLTIAKWQSQEPSADKRSNAAVISKASQGLFKAVPHSLFRPFICEFPSVPKVRNQDYDFRPPALHDNVLVPAAVPNGSPNQPPGTPVPPAGATTRPGSQQPQTEPPGTTNAPIGTSNAKQATTTAPVVPPTKPPMTTALILQGSVF